MPALTRRAVLAGVAGTAATLALGNKPAHAQLSHRVDVHTHYGSPAWLTILDIKNVLRAPLPSLRDWTPARMIEAMDKAGTQTAMLSLTSPGVWLGFPPETRRLARDCNEYAARMARQYPGRFGVWAVLPLPDVQGTLQEIAYSLDTLKADGVEVFTSYDNKWLGDPAFDPVLEELNRRHAVVFVHPSAPTCCFNLLPGIPDTTIEVQTDTTRAIARVVFSGASQRFPNVRFIWAHAGGTMTALNERLVMLAKTPQYEKLLPNGFLAEARKFYYDTAWTSNKTAMEALRTIIPPSQIVFGTDFPFRGIEDQVAALESSGVFTDGELAAIARGNTVALVPRVSSALGRS
jgi:predicted TIM-barrel fold metal-dependent hydrolase